MVERKQLLGEVEAPVLSKVEALGLKWLKQCRCGKRYYGNNSIKECGQCEPEIKETTLRMSKECECGCGKEFEKKDKPNPPKNERKYFNRACQMRARRRTEAGMVYVEEYNRRYKRVETEWICQYPMCGKMVISAYKRVFCEEHSGKPVNYTKRMKKKRPEVAASYNYTDSLRRKIKSGTAKTPPCTICGIYEKIEFHHPNYQEPKNVVPLCSKCHKLEHVGQAGRLFRPSSGMKVNLE